MNIQFKLIIDMVREAGQRIMDIYNTDFQIESKEDQSPLTYADRASHNIITNGLRTHYPDIPILSEEGKHIPYCTRENWRTFWLVDPLDGTKEFIKKNGEFTVNVALIQDEYPVWGAVHVPVTALTYVGDTEGAYIIDANNNKTSISACKPEKEIITLVESRSHHSPELEKLISTITKKYSNINRIKKGSSLKLCAIAEGTAHLYPRLGPTMEWDIAAGQAIVEAAGGEVIDLQGKRFHYNKENLLNEFFLVIGMIDVTDLLIQ